MSSENQKKIQCGLIMPISAIDDCTAEHWAEVKTIVCEACESITDPSVEAKLVSEEDAVGVIHKRIVQNVYSSDIIICDISGRNANVMFELGMRLAFDKATVLIKDDRTPYSFDTGVIEHIDYPRSLRFSSIVSFKQKLSEKLVATYKASKDPSHSTFLKNFGQFKTTALDQKVDSPEGVILDMLSQMQRDISRLGADRPLAISPSLPHEFSPVHSRAVPEMLEGIEKAEKLYGQNFWLTSSGLEKLIKYLEEHSECSRYWMNRSAFLTVLTEVLANGASGPSASRRLIRKNKVPPQTL